MVFSRKIIVRAEKILNYFCLYLGKFLSLHRVTEVTAAKVTKIDGEKRK